VEATNRLKFLYNKETLREVVGGAPGDYVTVTFRMLTGADDMAISDALITFDAMSVPHINQTASDVVKLCRSVDAISGLVVDGEEITQLTTETFKRLPRWMLVKIRTAANLFEAGPGFDQALGE